MRYNQANLNLKQAYMKECITLCNEKRKKKVFPTKVFFFLAQRKCVVIQRVVILCLVLQYLVSCNCRAESQSSLLPVTGLACAGAAEASDVRRHLQARHVGCPNLGPGAPARLVLRELRER